MQFDNPEQVESVCLQLRQQDYLRGLDRALIARLFNGNPPYLPHEVEENNIDVNLNWLEATALGHDARQQFTTYFEKPANYFTCSTDAGAVHKRRERGAIATRNANRIMKRSLPYSECRRSKFASLVLYGIGPVVRPNPYRWCPKAIGIDDLLLEEPVELTFEDLTQFCILREFTGPQLSAIVNGPQTGGSWNKPLIKKLLKWIDSETGNLLSSDFPSIWSPEKWEERDKANGGYYVGGRSPKVKAYDFWFYSDAGKTAGWRRRMVIDDWSPPSGSGGWTRGTTADFARNQWLYNSKDRVIASRREEIFSCQYGDLSAVAPFHHHTVRGLGSLTYAVCHLQNRLRCRFTEAVFEDLMILMRASGEDDALRSLKANFINRGIVPPNIKFVTKDERWQPNIALTEMGIQENSRLIARHASSYTSSLVQQATDKREKTKFEVMSELSSATQLVGASLQQAARYEAFEDRETFRRLCKKNSTDPEARQFQARCIKEGIPESVLYNHEAWDIEPEQVMGNGNKALEMAIAQQLLAMRNLYDPEPQRTILRDITLAVTGDAARAKQLVPETPQISDSIHDGQLRFGTLMQGVPVDTKSGVNHIEVIETLLKAMELVVQRITKTTGVGTREEILGLITVGQHIAGEMSMLAQDENEKQRVKQYGDKLGQLMNLVKAFAQRLAEQEQGKNGKSEIDPETQAKIEAVLMQAKVKAENARTAHAQRTAQRQVQFELEEQRKQKEFEREQRRELERSSQELATGQLKAGQEIAMSREKAAQAKESDASTER